MSNNKYIICDLPNTMLNSMQRTDLGETFITGIENDTLNYSAYNLVRDLVKQGYTPVFTHYCLSRLADKVQNVAHKYGIDRLGKIYTNFATQQVYDNITLKMYVFEQILAKETVSYVIDNDSRMRAYWTRNYVGLLNAPLTLEYLDDVDI